MQQRHWVLSLFILVGAGLWAIHEIVHWRIFGEYTQTVLLAYMLLAGVFVGFEARGLLPSQGRDAGGQPPAQRKRDRRSFDRQYREALYNRYRDLDAVGLSMQQYSLDMDKVFELPLLASSEHVQQGAARPPRVEGARTIWEQLAVPRWRFWPYLFLDERQARHFVLIGSPGSGKTTLLRYMALTFARGTQRKFDPPLRNLTPIIIALRDHVEAIKDDPQISIAKLASDYLRRRWELKAQERWFSMRLRYGRCIVLLDGLDEIADEQDRRLVVGWVQTQLQAAHNNYFLITSRPYGYRSNPLDDVVVLDVQPFSAPQIKQFVHKWYLAAEHKSKGRVDEVVQRIARERAEDLDRRLTTNPNLTALAANPLLLTMIATVHRFLHRLPEKRVELYREIFEVFLTRRQPDNNDLVTLQKLRVLSPLAYWMHCNRQHQIHADAAARLIAGPLAEVSLGTDAAKFLKRTVEMSELILESEAGVYRFAHLTYQEYLAAVHIQRHRLEGELRNHVDEEWWHETILLFAALDDASDILDEALARASGSSKALSLGVTILEEAISLRLESRSRFLAYLAESIESADPVRKTLIADSLLRNDLRRAAVLDEKERRWIGTALISHAAYQRFINEQQQHERRFYAPDHWIDREFPAGQAQQPILGVRLEDAQAFCAWLTARDRDGWRYRLPLERESEEYQSEVRGKARYWLSNVPPAVVGGRWCTPQELVRSRLAEYLFADIGSMQILAVQTLIEQVRSEVSDLNNLRRREVNLVSEIDTVQSIADRSNLIAALLGALDAAGYARVVGALGSLIRVATFVQDKARLARERFTEARVAATASSSALLRKDELGARAAGDMTDHIYHEALVPIQMINQQMHQTRDALAQFQSVLPAYLGEHHPVGQQLRQLLDRGGFPVMMSLAMSTSSIQRELLVDTREHLVLSFNDVRLRELAQSGLLPLDVTHAAECARVFDRSSATRPAIAGSERVFLRYWSLLCALIWVSRSAQQENGEWTRAQREQGLRFCRGMNVDLALLEERIHGRLAPVEGIRLVREPKF